MNQIFSTCILNRYVHQFLKESRRCAGHSKWQNIKHQKEENDASRATQYMQLRRKIKAAVIEGGSTQPSSNIKLARLLEQCKKLNMPTASLNDFLKKLAASKGTGQSSLIHITGPRSCHMIIRLMSDNIVDAKLRLHTVVKKINARITEGSLKSLFSHTGSIIIEKKNELDKVMEDAINVEAIDVKEIEDDNNTYYKFICEPHLIPKIATQLKNLEYHIITTKEEIVPLSTIKVSDEELQIIQLAQKKLSTMDEVHEIYDNIDHNATTN